MSSETIREQLVRALSNVHSLEGNAITTLENVGSRLESYPAFRDAVRAHLQESRRQQKTIEECLHRLGEEPSAFKEFAMRGMANVQALMNAMAGAVEGDEVVKYTFALFAFEHYEIAAYRSLIEMAQAAGQSDIEAECRRILEEEKKAAETIGGMIEQITRTYMGRETVNSGMASR